MSYEYSREDDYEDYNEDEDYEDYENYDEDEEGPVEGQVEGPVYYEYGTPPAYVIIGHGKERQVNGEHDLKYRVANEKLSFIAESGEVAYHDVTEIVKGLTSDLDAYTDFSREDGVYIDIDVSYEPEVELGGLYLMYRGQIQDIWTLENEAMPVSTLVQYVVDNHDNIMDTFLEDGYYQENYPKPEIRIWCLTCRVHYVQGEETRREPVYDPPYEEDPWYNNDGGADYHRERQRWVNGDGYKPYHPYQLNRLTHPLNANDNYVNNGYGKGNGTHSVWGGSRKSIKRKRYKKRMKKTLKSTTKKTTKKRMKKRKKRKKSMKR
jgi:hypothetical protein